MIGTNVSRGEARIGAWIARGLSGALLLGALGTVVFGGSEEIQPPELPQAGTEEAPGTSTAGAQPEAWDAEAVASLLAGWDGPAPDQGPPPDTRSTGEGLTPTPQPMKYLGRLTIGGSERALVAVGAEQRFVPVSSEIGGYTIERIEENRVLITDGRSRRNIPLEQRGTLLGAATAPPPVNPPIVDPRQAAEERAAERARTIRSGDGTISTTPSFTRQLPDDSDASGSDDGSEGS